MKIWSRVQHPGRMLRGDPPRFQHPSERLTDGTMYGDGDSRHAFADPFSKQQDYEGDDDVVGFDGYVHGDYEDENDEETPLLVRPNAETQRVTWASRLASWMLISTYFLLMAINGAMVGALGPSLSQIAKATGLHDDQLGRFVLQNRLCKLAGTLVWCGYARHLQRPRAVGRPHAVFAGLLLLTAASAVCIARATTPFAVQFGLVSWGLAYGITDSGVTSLTVWRWVNDNRRRRVDLALLNSGFTVGAMLAPILVAASLRSHARGWAFDAVAVVCCLVSAAFYFQPDVAIPTFPEQDPSRQRPSAAAADGGGGGRGGGSWRLTRRRAFELAFIGSMSIVSAAITGCEHGLGTWLPAFGIEEGRLSPQRMAVSATAPAACHPRAWLVSMRACGHGPGHVHVHDMHVHAHANVRPRAGARGGESEGRSLGPLSLRRPLPLTPSPPRPLAPANALR